MTMGYVIAAIIVVVIVGAFVLLLVTNATRKSNVSDARDPGAEQNPLGIIGSDRATPAGDTDQHSDSVTAAQPDPATQRGPTDRPGEARPVVGGEGEAERQT
jgi:hypothetical protein